MNFRPFYYLSLLLLLLATIVHLFALSGVDVESKIGFVWLLHVGIFAAFFPALLSIFANEKMIENGQKVRGFKMLKVIFEHTPTWLCWLVAATYTYAIFTFLFFSNGAGGSPEIVDGNYVLQNRNGIVRTLTEIEYHDIKASILKGFSASWLIFYSFAVGVLYKFR